MTTVLLVHGFLDDVTVWDDVVSALPGNVNAIGYQLPGFGTRAGHTGEITMTSLAAEAATLIQDLDSEVIVVGQSMGTQIAELVAVTRPDRVAGLVLITPVPLGGTRLSEANVGPFRASGSDHDAQRAARLQLSPRLTDEQLERLTRAGASARQEVVSRYVDVWNDGVADAPAVSDFTGPVLLIRGGTDPFVDADLFATVSTRFPQAREQVVDGGGHWLHVEFPRQVAAAIAEFAADNEPAASAADWRHAFAEQSSTTFADSFAEDVVLDATTLMEPVKGKDRVAATLAAASSIYETLEFTAETADGSTSYIQWRATAFGGMKIRGLTILERDDQGRIISAAIHHRPLGAVLRFAREIRDRLAGVIAQDHFLEDAS
jgi:pimeloyl-ACP methyl ester carboxylesterase/ketosteroid isomerase-like protein